MCPGGENRREYFPSLQEHMFYIIIKVSHKGGYLDGFTGEITDIS